MLIVQMLFFGLTSVGAAVERLKREIAKTVSNTLSIFEEETISRAHCHKVIDLRFSKLETPLVLRDERINTMPQHRISITGIHDV